jgi:hypothetical protein
MSELLCSRSSTGSDDDFVAIAVRPSPLQIAGARFSLLLSGKEGRLPIGVAMFAIGIGLGVGGLQFLQFVLRYGVLDALRICASGIASLTLLSTAGGAALLLHAARGAEPLSRIELEGGVLLQLDSQGLAATVRGATTYHDWEHVAVRPIAFVLPRRMFHFLPWSALSIDDAERLRALLARAKFGPERFLVRGEFSSEQRQAFKAPAVDCPTIRTSISPILRMGEAKQQT